MGVESFPNAMPLIDQKDQPFKIRSPLTLIKHLPYPCYMIKKVCITNLREDGDIKGVWQITFLHTFLQSVDAIFKGKFASILALLHEAIFYLKPTCETLNFAPPFKV